MEHSRKKWGGLFYQPSIGLLLDRGLAPDFFIKIGYKVLQLEKSTFADNEQKINPASVAVHFGIIF
jgi:hypothetical protein